MKEKRMNCERARNICIIKTLSRFGHFPTKESEQEAFFLSFLRSENQASLKISKKLNRWYDHGASIGGNVIDLVCLLLKCSVSETLNFLNTNSLDFSFQQPAKNFDNKSQIKIIKVIDIKHPALVQYLNSRKITLATAKIYCKEVWYSCNDKQCFSIGFQNDKGGWELRNKIYKNCSSPKSYTYLKNSATQLIILEGMFDFLSLYELNKEIIAASDTIILNSIGFIARIENQFLNYEKILLYLDNDNAGKKAAIKIKEEHAHVFDMSFEYENFKDLNELILWN